MSFQTVHGHSRTRHRSASPTHRTWSHMLSRCRHANRFYGGRGIIVCERWKSFPNFLSDMGLRPDGKSIDRININGNYEPGNCRWVTQREQCSNMRSNRWITFNGETLTLAEWSERTGIKRETIAYRLNRKWATNIALRRMESAA